MERFESSRCPDSYDPAPNFREEYHQSATNRKDVGKEIGKSPLHGFPDAARLLGKDIQDGAKAVGGVIADGAMSVGHTLRAADCGVKDARPATDKEIADWQKKHAGEALPLAQHVSR
jgi:hypothetical protein